MVDTVEVSQSALVKSVLRPDTGVEHSGASTERAGRKVEGNDKNVAITADRLTAAANDVAAKINPVVGKDLSFSVENELNRMVLVVRAVGSDEIVRQFPPDEFLTVAKFISEQDISVLDEDFLKGILFDQYS
jgi:uncharacterized FlaG/YvyC family protein